MSTAAADRLRAGLDEDERVAQACAEGTGLQAVGLTWHVWDGAGVRDEHDATVVYDEGAPTAAEAAHIARNDPARALRDIAARRRILAAYEEAERASRGYVEAGLGESEDEVGTRLALESVVEILAGVYEEAGETARG